LGKGGKIEPYTIIIMPRPGGFTLSVYAATTRNGTDSDTCLKKSFSTSRLMLIFTKSPSKKP
jgi:hypothetical protein